MTSIKSTNLLPNWLSEFFTSEQDSSHIFYFEALESTMLTAKALINNGQATDKDVVLAEEQTGGRGRRGRFWASPRGGLWFSVLVKPHIPNEKYPLMALVAALAVVEVIRSQTKLAAVIKWPNDVLIEGRKVCGIAVDLVFDEHKRPWAVLGIGLNANLVLEQIPDELQPTATTLRHELGRECDRGAILMSLLESLFVNFALLKTEPEILFEKWALYNVTLNNTVTVYPANGALPYIGQAIAIDPDGALLVKDQQGQLRRVLAADVSVRCVEAPDVRPE